MVSNNEIHIQGEANQHVKIYFKEVYGFPESTSFSGGYDVEGQISIVSGNYSVNGTLWFTTGELYLFYQGLMMIYNTFTGQAKLNTFEGNLELLIEIDKRGRVTVSGRYKEYSGEDNELSFSFEADQSYLVKTLEDLKKIKISYGGMKGIKDQ